MNENIKIATRQSYGEELAKLGEENKQIVVLDADLSTATKTELFAKKFPDRFINVGIAEQNLMGIAAGRAYEQIRNSIAYPKLNVKICATHAGITVGEDGATHQMLEDLGLMRSLPNMTVMCTSDDIQTKWAVREISKINGPVYLRLCRLATPVIYDTSSKFEIGKAVQIGEGTDAAILATGVTVSEAIKAKEILKEKGIDVRVIDFHTIKPIDRKMIIKCAKETNRIITVEDHSIIGGLGSSVCEVLSEVYPVKVERMGIVDTFGESGKADELMRKYKIDSTAIVEKILELDK